MTKEDKELLLKDLSARLAYSLWIHFEYDSNSTTIDEDRFLDFEDVETLKYTVDHPESEGYAKISWKPYLRPMSSMTEEEFVYFMGLRGRNLSRRDIRQMMKELFNIPNRLTIVLQLFNYLHKMDWLLSKHFDVRGLIPKGLAIEATEDMYKN